MLRIRPEKKRIGLLVDPIAMMCLMFQLFLLGLWDTYQRNDYSFIKRSLNNGNLKKVNK